MKADSPKSKIQIVVTKGLQKSRGNPRAKAKQKYKQEIT